jgi:hypothetical protein
LCHNLGDVHNALLKNLGLEKDWGTRHGAGRHEHGLQPLGGQESSHRGGGRLLSGHFQT